MWTDKKVSFKLASVCKRARQEMWYLSCHWTDRKIILKLNRKKKDYRLPNGIFNAWLVLFSYVEGLSFLFWSCFWSPILECSWELENNVVQFFSFLFLFFWDSRKEKKIIQIFAKKQKTTILILERDNRLQAPHESWSVLSLSLSESFASHFG